MSFKDQMKQDIEMIIDELGDSGIYVVKESGVSISTKAVLERNESLGSWDTGGQAEFARLSVKKSAVAKPVRYDTWAVDGETWTVESIVGGDVGSWTVRLSRDQRMG